MLSFNDKKCIINLFPNIKLSYEHIINKKVCYEYKMLIPKGIKAYMWITYVNNKSICLLLTLTHNKIINKVNNYNLCYNEDLSYGTIFYGTIFKINNNTYFSFEDIHYYKGKKISHYTFINKLKLLKYILTNEVKQKLYNDSFIIPGLPIITKKKDDIDTIHTLKYDIYAIKYYDKNNNILGTEKYYNETRIFNVKAELEPDIYNLYGDDKCIEFKGIACISSYKKSVFMNNIFRNIKENKNLDLLEESDDDEDFENTSIDKYVNLNKYYKMKCVYNIILKKWEPLTIVN